MKWFTELKTLEELKKAYHKLIFKYHPDRGGDTATMQDINREYESLFARLKNKHSDKDGNVYEKNTDEKPEEFRELLEKLMKLANITIECVGCFIWVGGDTYNNKEELKRLGFKFSRKKEMWYKAPEDWTKKGNKEYKMDEIRDKYGVQYKTTTAKSVALPV